MEKHPDYPNFVEARESLRRHSGDVPLLYTWAIDMLQEIERSLAISSVLRKQLSDIESTGLDALDPDLWTDRFDLVADQAIKKQNFQAKITSAVDNWPVDEGHLVAAVLKHNFAYLDTSGITRFKDVFHLVRQTRNRLAHNFFLEHAEEKTSDIGVQSMERELEAVVIDVHFVGELANTLVGAFVRGLHEAIKDLLSTSPGTSKDRERPN